MAVEPRDPAPPQQLVDEWAPGDLEWEHLVRTYPLPAMAAAAVAGFLVGKNHGPAILAAFAGYAGRQLRGMVDDRGLHS